LEEVRGTGAKKDIRSAERRDMENTHQRQRLLEAEVKIQVAQKILQEAALDLDARAKRQRKGGKHR